MSAPRIDTLLRTTPVTPSVDTERVGAAQPLERWFERLPIIEDLSREVLEIQKRRAEDGVWVGSAIVAKRSAAKAHRERFEADTARLKLISRFLMLPTARIRGLSMDTYLGMLADQDCRCAICRCELSPECIPFVDHNHTTGEVRGMLCHSCNTGLGLLGDSPDRMRVALTYLEDRGHYGEVAS